MKCPKIKKFDIESTVTSDVTGTVLTCAITGTIEGASKPFDLLQLVELYGTVPKLPLFEFFKAIFKDFSHIRVNTNCDYITLVNDVNEPIHTIDVLNMNKVEIATTADVDEYVTYILGVIKYTEVMYTEFNAVTTSKTWSNANLDEDIKRIPKVYPKYSKDR